MVALLHIHLQKHYENIVSFRSPSLFYLLVHSRCRGCLVSLDHTQTHTTVSRTPLDEGSARRRDLYLTTQTLYKRQKNPCSGEIRTHDPSKRSAADPRLRPRGHWDHYENIIIWKVFRKQTVVKGCKFNTNLKFVTYKTSSLNFVNSNCARIFAQRGELRYISILYLSSALDRGGWSTPHHGCFPPGEKDPVPIVRNAGWAPGPV
jgi:hypothetical protein